MRTEVAVYLPTLEAGGAERVMLTVANSLAERGYSVQLVVGNAKGGFRRDVSDTVELVDLDLPAVPIVPTLGVLIPFYRYLSRENPGVVISSMIHVNVVLLLAWKLSDTTSRMVVTEHNNPTEIMRNSITNRVAYEAASFEYPWADRVIAVSDGVADSLSEVLDVPREEIARIYNPVVSDELKAQSSQHVDHPWLDREGPVLLNVGRLTEQKNQALLLNAFSRVRDRFDAKLLIVGTGENERSLRDLIGTLGIGDHVEIINWVDNPYAFMASADVFVLSSRYEGLPTVLIEALACGCQVVSTDCPSGPREILEDGKYGTLVEVQDPEALAEGVGERIRDPIDEDLLEKRGEDFSVERCIEDYERLVQDLIQSERSRPGESP